MELLVEKPELALNWLIRGERWRSKIEVVMPVEAMRSWEALRNETMGLSFYKNPCSCKNTGSNNLAAV